MTTEEERKPAYRKESFTCPYCEVYSPQNWGNPLRGFSVGSNSKKPANELDKMENLFAAECSVCNKISVWMNEKMIYPVVSPADKPAINMPDNVRKIYEEASLVSIHSPRAAAVLLRVAAEMLTAHLGEPEGKLYDRIRNLAKKKNLDERVINSFDIVRYKANKGGAHDNIINQIITIKEINKLFFSINYIVKEMINEPAKLDDIYGEIPQSARERIAKDDKPKDKT